MNRNMPAHFSSSRPHRITCSRWRTACQVARSIAYQNFLIWGWAPRHFGVTEAVRLELAPGVQSALVTECQVACLADFALRRLGVEGAVGDAKDFASSDAIGLITGIMGRIEATVGIELPLLVADPS